jgi:hypothetical protein
MLDARPKAENTPIARHLVRSLDSKPCLLTGAEMSSRKAARGPQRFWQGKLRALSQKVKKKAKINLRELAIRRHISSKLLDAGSYIVHLTTCIPFLSSSRHPNRLCGHHLNIAGELKRCRRLREEE